MMSPDSIPSKPVCNDNQSSGSRKTGPLKPPEESPKCPRCDSSNTKFCYYNNYSLTQPRHFCKTCRRYWTKGGALRNVPIGGGCRKNKKTKSNSRLPDDSKDFVSSSDIGGLKLFHGLSPTMEFQLGRLPFSRLNPSTSGVYNPYATTATNPTIFDVEASASSGSLMGFNWGFNGGIQETGSINVNSSLATSIESLSCINQDLHWKLQQQRLGMILGGENQKEGSVSSALLENQVQKPQPISFQNLEISKPEACAVSNPRKSGGVNGNITTTEWFLENSYTPTTNNNGSSNSNDDLSNWNGIQAWTDLHQYNALPQ